MVRRILLPFGITSIFVLLVVFDSLTNGGGANAGLTGAPRSTSGNEPTCTNCHSGQVNSGAFIDSIKFTGNFVGGGYVPDSTYQVTVKFRQPSTRKVGFQATVLNSSNTMAGSLDAGANGTRKVTGNSRDYITHNFSGTSTTGDSIKWTFDWTAPSSNVGPVKFYVALNRTNSNNGTSGDTVYTKSFSVGTSNQLTQATATSDTNVYCANEDIQMKGSGTNNPTSYQWTFPQGNPSTSTLQNPTVKWSFSGTKYAILRTQNSLSWSDPDTFELTIKSAPTAFIQGSFPATICPGDSVKLQAAVRTGYTYLWNTNETGNNIYAKKAGSYQVAVTSSDGCSRISSAVEVKEFTRPTTTITSSATRDSSCSGNVVTFTAQTGFDSTYLYKDFNRVATSDKNAITYRMDQDAKFNMKVKDANGCISNLSDTIDMTVNQRLGAPVVTCVDKTTSKLTFEWTDTSAGHASQYQVSTDGGNSWSNITKGVKSYTWNGLSPETDYELSVRSVEQFPCFYSRVGSAVCRTGECNTINVTAEFDSTVCEGTENLVIIRGLKDKKFSMSFEGGALFTDTSFSFEPVLSKTYSIELIDSGALGCPAEIISLPITVESIGQVTLNTEDGSTSFCSYDTVKLQSIGGLDEYKYYVNGVLQSTTQDSFYNSTFLINMDSVWVIGSKGVCADTSDVINLTIYPEPDASFTYTRDWKIYTFQPNVAFHSTYRWDFGDGDTSAMVTPQHDYSASEGQTVTVKLDVEGNAGCVSSYSEDIDLPMFSSVNDINRNGFKIYPNPASDIITVEFTTSVGTDARVSLLDLNGRVISETEAYSSLVRIDVTDLSAGVYMVKVEDEGKTSTQQIQIK